MKKFFVGLLVGLCALGVMFIFDIEINLANYLLGYSAGAIAILILSPTKRAADVCQECRTPRIVGEDRCRVCGTRR